MTQEELAHRSQLGITTIRDLERGLTTFPQEGTIRQLADTLGLDGPARTQFVAAAPKRAESERYRSAVRETSVAHLRPSRTPVTGTSRLERTLSVSLPPRTPLLAGREELLSDLGIRLTAPVGSSPRITVLSGLGGVGKTTVAAEYAYRALDTVSVAWQLSAGDRATLIAGLEKLTAQLGVLDLVDARDPVASVHAVLAGWPSPWLLIFDNAPDQESVLEFLPPAGQGQILITSQSPLWPRRQVIEVTVLDLNVAAQFLRDTTGDSDHDAALALAAELGGLPLALEQAAAHMQATGRSMAGFLTLYRERRDELLARGQPGAYDKLVTTTWTLAFDQLKRAHPAAISLLGLLAWFAPEHVPLDLLLRPSNVAQPVPPELGPLLGDRLAADDAVAALRRFSLIGPPRDGLVSVHRLVQAVTRSQMQADEAEQWRQTARQLIEAALPANPEQPATWSAYDALLPHAQAVLPAESGGFARVAAFLAHSGSYAAARDSQQLIADAAVRAHGTEHPTALAARALLAHWTGQAGDFAAARDQFAALVILYERKLGRQHPDTLAIRAGLAEWTGQAGDPATARDQYTELIPALEHELGTEHSETLTARADLAYMTGLAGDPAAARDEYADLLIIRQRVSGPEHPDTLLIRTELASATGQAGDPAQARDQYAELLVTLDRVLGPEHPDSLIARANMAYMTGMAGDPAAARDQYADLLAIRQQVSGPEHPETLTVRANLARWTAQAGDAISVLDQIAAVAAIRARVLGPEHPRTLIDRANLARATGEAGDPASARDQFAALLSARERVLGAEHPQTLTTRGNLAYMTGLAGDPATARDQLAALLPVQQRRLGVDHPDTLSTRANLAQMTGLAGDPATARDLLASLLPAEQRVLGADHPRTATDRESLARWSDEAAERDKRLS